MKVAISTDGEYVSAHFGRCPSFTILEFADGNIIHNHEIENPGHHPGYLPQFFNEMSVNCIVAGSMGGRASELFAQYNIQPILGISGRVEDTIAQLLDGKLKGAESLCQPGQGKGYGVDKTECDHEETDHERTIS
ncbi:NifB/NifX family molybdenum-iron cluster-binding protein [bacterium]